jgi:hypothetical protein
MWIQFVLLVYTYEVPKVGKQISVYHKINILQYGQALVDVLRRKGIISREEYL